MTSPSPAPLSALIVDDEAPARAKLRRLLAGEPRVAIAGEATSGAEAVAKIVELSPALVFLDVQMPAGNGFDVLEALPAGTRPLIVFSTAYDSFALRAFEAAAVDYLLKPYDEARFRVALQRVIERANERANERASAGDSPRLLEEVRRAPVQRLLVKDGEAWLAVRLEEVWRFESEDKHVRIHGAAGAHLFRQSLRALEARLDPRQFVRVHRGEIVRLDAVARLEPWTHGDSILTLTDGATVVLSRTYREAFLARWQGG
jgi:two-component system, LytTR family, response regulator